MSCNLGQCCFSFCGLVTKTGGKLIFGLVVVNIIAIITGLAISIAYPVLLSSVVIAYTLGLRHAVDADHLAAIDNVTRRMVSEGKKPTTVGLYFSLGHSTIVFGLTAFVAVTASVVSDYWDNAATYGELIGTFISASFLYLIGGINLYCLIVLTLEWRKYKKESDENPREYLTIPQNLTLDRPPDDKEFDELQKKDENKAMMGCCTKCCPKFLNIIDKPYKMYFVGFLFGLGFDTASEIALLSMAALAPGEGVPPLLVMILPVVFASGMALIDTLDGIMMIWAYGWAFVEPDKKYFYNFVVTITSTSIALLVGTLEVLGVIGTWLDLDSPFWQAIELINFETVGILIIILFIVFFIIAIISYKIRFGCDKTTETIEHITQLDISSSDEEIDDVPDLEIGASIQ